MTGLKLALCVGVLALAAGQIRAQSYFNAPLVLQPVPSPFTKHARDGRTPLVADVTGDAVMDLLLTEDGSWPGSSYAVSCLVGQPGGGFGPAVYTALSFPQFILEIQDFDLDGNADLLINDGSILLGDGAGGFGVGVIPGLGSGAAIYAHGDLTGDGAVDLVVSFGPWVWGGPIPSLQVWSWKSASAAWVQVLTILTDINLGVVSLGDFNGDGRRDLLVVGVQGRSCCAAGLPQAFVLINQGEGFEFTQVGPLGLGLLSYSNSVITDVNLDGCDDLVAASLSTGSLMTFLGDPVTTFQPPIQGPGACPAICALNTMQSPPPRWATSTRTASPT